MNQRTHGQYAKTALLQHNLWKIGVFRGVKDRRGNKVDYYDAVDGVKGRMTNTAIKRAQKLGYAVDLQTGSIYKSGLPAIMEHKTRYHIHSPYIVVDKKRGTMSVYKGNKMLESHRITLGKQQGDALIPTDSDIKYYGQLPSMTGAGIFTVVPRPTSPYIGREPMLTLRNNSPLGHFAMAIHSPANNTDRMAPFRNPRISNRVSYGCISPNAGVVRHLYNDKVIQEGDSVYILPELRGNSLIEKDGILQMLWGPQNPTTYIDNTGKRRSLKYNNNR